jgi:protein SCO1/2
MKQIIFFIVILTSLNGCNRNSTSELPYYISPDYTPVWLKNSDAENIHKIDDFRFTDQDGKLFSGSELNGKVYVADFFFTSCPGICPAITKNLTKVQNEFINNENVSLVSYSVLPQSDSAAALKNYEKNFSIKNGKWHLLTGNTSEIYSLARRSYFVEKNAGYNSDSTEFLHTENVVLVDKKGRIRGIYNGTIALDMERIINDIKVLLKES